MSCWYLGSLDYFNLYISIASRHWPRKLLVFECCAVCWDTTAWEIQDARSFTRGHLMGPCLVGIKLDANVADNVEGFPWILWHCLGWCHIMTPVTESARSIGFRKEKRLGVLFLGHKTVVTLVFREIWDPSNYLHVFSLSRDDTTLKGFCYTPWN